MKNLHAFREIAFGETKELTKYQEKTSLAHNDKRSDESHKTTAYRLENTHQKTISFSKKEDESSYQMENSELPQRRGYRIAFEIYNCLRHHREKYLQLFFN